MALGLSEDMYPEHSHHHGIDSVSPVKVISRQEDEVRPFETPTGRVVRRRG